MRQKLMKYILDLDTRLLVVLIILIASALTTCLNVIYSVAFKDGKMPIAAFAFGVFQAILLPLIIAPVVINSLKHASDLETENQQLEHEVLERQRTEAEAQHRAGQLQEISEFAIELAAASPDADLPRLITEKLRELTGAIAVSFSSYDSERRALIVQYVAVSGRILSAVNSMLGQNIVGLANPVTDEMLQRMLTEVVETVHNLNAATLGMVPKPVAAAVKQAFNIESFTGLALSYLGRLWGTTIIVSRTGEPEIDRDVAMTFAHIAAVALRRQKAEQALRQREEQLRETVKELKNKTAELERFTYTVSHDLKSPLITIKGFLGILEQDALSGDSENLRRDITFIANAADQMQHLLEELLELSRVGRLMNPAQDILMSVLAHEAADIAAGQLHARGVQVDIASDMPLVSGDRLRLREVFENLLNNAAKYMGDQPHPRIEIGARQDDGYTVFYVRDNGIGIEAQNQERVFDLFTKLDPDSDGTGIGLAIVKRIVEAHGGQIWVESKGAGYGSTFCFTLGAAPDQAI